MIFINNKYTKIYNSIIDNALSRSYIEGYTEMHHIIPKSLGGSNDSSNLVRLTPREHFVCHWLLVKMTKGNDLKKMWHALRTFRYKGTKNPRYGYKINSRLYDRIKREQAKIASEEQSGVLFWNNGVKQVKSKECPGPGFKRGRLIKEKRQWWTNGKNNKWQPKSPGLGWHLGRTINHNKTKWNNGMLEIFSVDCPGPGWKKGGKPHSEETKSKLSIARKKQKTPSCKKVKIIDHNGIKYEFKSVVVAARTLFGTDKKYGKLSHLVRLCQKGSKPRKDSELYGWYAEYL